LADAAGGADRQRCSRPDDGVVTYFQDLGMKVTGIMTDKSSCYRAKAFAKACKRPASKHFSHQAMQAADKR